MTYVDSDIKLYSKKEFDKLTNPPASKSELSDLLAAKFTINGYAVEIKKVGEELRVIGDATLRIEPRAANNFRITAWSS